MCNEDVTGNGNGKIKSVDRTDTCRPVVTMEHAAGCPEITANALVRWLEDNPWFLATICLIAGAASAFAGRKFFPGVAAFVTFLGTTLGVCVFTSEMGWLDSSSWAKWVVLIVAIIIGVLVAEFVRRTIWFAVGIAGVFGGWCLGMLCFSIMAASTNHAEQWEMITFGVVLAIVGGFLSFKFGKEMIVIITAFLGSYIFMRGWTFIFDGYPSEHAMWHYMKDDRHIHFSENFWIFIGVWVVTFIVGLSVQWKALDDHHTVSDHYSKK